MLGAIGEFVLNLFDENILIPAPSFKWLMPQNLPTLVLLARKQALSRKSKWEGWIFFSLVRFTQKRYPFRAISVQIVDVVPMDVFVSGYPNLAFKHCSTFEAHLICTCMSSFLGTPRAARRTRGERSSRSKGMC